MRNQRINIEKYAEKQLSFQERFMRDLAKQGINLKIHYSILTAKELLAEVKREAKLYCK
jgi:hypothetical protein